MNYSSSGKGCIKLKDTSKGGIEHQLPSVRTATFYQTKYDKSRMEEDAVRIKELRLAAGLTQAQLAKKMNVDQTAVSRWESGNTEPMRKTHKKLAKVLGVTLDELKREE